MILLSELSRRRIRSVQKLIRVGRDEVVVVLRVDEEKGKLPPTLRARVCVRFDDGMCRLTYTPSTCRLH